MCPDCQRATAERDEAIEGECARAVERDTALAQVAKLKAALEDAADAYEDACNSFGYDEPPEDAKENLARYRAALAGSPR